MTLPDKPPVASLGGRLFVIGVLDSLIYVVAGRLRGTGGISIISRLDHGLAGPIR